MLPVKVLLFEKADPSLVSIKIELSEHLGVIISLLARSRRKYIFLFFSKVKFWRVVRRFLTTSRQPLDQFGWKLARLLLDSFSRKPCLRILIPLFVLKLDFFPREVLIYLSSLTSSADKRTKNTLFTNLRHSFLAIGVEKRMQC